MGTDEVYRLKSILPPLCKAPTRSKLRLKVENTASVNTAQVRMCTCTLLGKRGSALVFAWFSAQALYRQEAIRGLDMHKGEGGCGRRRPEESNGSAALRVALVWSRLRRCGGSGSRRGSGGLAGLLRGRLLGL